MPTSPALSRARRRTPQLAAVAAAATALLAACAFISSATELTFGAPDVPEVDADAMLSVSQLNQALEAAAPIPEDLAAELERLEQDGADTPLVRLPADATWAHVRSTLCDAYKLGLLPAPALPIGIGFEESPDAAQSNLVGIDVLMEVDLGDAPEGDLSACYQGAMRLAATVEFRPFTEAQAQTIRDQLATDLGALENAILQIRFQFHRLGFQRTGADGEPIAHNEVLRDFRLVVEDESIADRPDTPYEEGVLEIVPAFLLETITPDTPQRFELDPDSPVTRELKAAVVSLDGDKTLKLSIEALLDGSALGTLTLDASGVGLEMQPEITISALQAAQELL